MKGQLELLKVFDNENIVEDYDIANISLKYSDMFKAHMVILESRCGFRFIKYVKPNGELAVEGTVEVVPMNRDTRAAFIYQCIQDGYIQTEIADMIGVSQYTISKLHIEYRKENTSVKKANISKIEHTFETMNQEKNAKKNYKDIKRVLTMNTYSVELDNQKHVCIKDYLFNDLSNVDMKDKYGLGNASVSNIISRSDVYHVMQLVFKKLSAYNNIDVIHKVLFGQISINKLKYMMDAFYSKTGVNKDRIKDKVREIYIKNGYQFKQGSCDEIIRSENISYSIMITYKAEIVAECRVAKAFDIDSFIEMRRVELYKKGVVVI